MSGDTPSKWVTTADVVAAAGVTDATVIRWSKRGVLPPFKTIYGGRRGRSARWPAHALEQAAWVKAKLEDAWTFDEILEALAKGEFSAKRPE